MKKNKLSIAIIIIGILFFINHTSFSQATNDSIEENNPDNYKIIKQYSTILTLSEIEPTFPGGQKALDKFLKDNINYPDKAKRKGIKGTVYVTFVVRNNGTITNIKLLLGIGGGCDEEAIRVVKLMPNWIPGKQRGENVSVQYNLPIKFDMR